MPKELHKSLLRRRTVWLALIAIPYLLSFFWLGFAALAWPWSIGYATMGLIALFDRTFYPADHFRYHSIYPVVMIQLGFWVIYFAAFIGARAFPISVLRTAFIVLAMTLFLTYYGCQTLMIRH